LVRLSLHEESLASLPIQGVFFTRRVCQSYFATFDYIHHMIRMGMHRGLVARFENSSHHTHSVVLHLKPRDVARHY
jgi:hypothetical protein